jgi:hypothetical protein
MELSLFSVQDKIFRKELLILLENNNKYNLNEKIYVLHSQCVIKLQRVRTIEQIYYAYIFFLAVYALSCSVIAKQIRAELG